MANEFSSWIQSNNFGGIRDCIENHLGDCMEDLAACEPADQGRGISSYGQAQAADICNRGSQTQASAIFSRCTRGSIDAACRVGDVADSAACRAGCHYRNASTGGGLS